MTTDSLGFKDIGFRDDGINGEPFAVVVGDSFTFGLGVNATDTWVEILEKVKSLLPKEAVSRAELEGSELIVYTKDRDCF